MHAQFLKREEEKNGETTNIFNEVFDADCQ